MSSLFSASMAAKAKLALVIFSLAIATFLLLYKTYHRLVDSFNHNTYLILLFHLILVSLLLIFRTTSQTIQTQTAPQFSFHSTSPPLSVSSPSIPSTQCFPSLSKQSQHDGPASDIIYDLKEPIFNISPSPQANIVVESRNETLQQEITTTSSLERQEQADTADEDDQSMDDTWKEIVAKGGAKPIKIKKIKREMQTRTRK